MDRCRLLRKESEKTKTSWESLVGEEKVEAKMSYKLKKMERLSLAKEKKKLGFEKLLLESFIKVFVSLSQIRLKDNSLRNNVQFPLNQMKKFMPLS
ncbi:hypothetical protein CEXT_294881 [Caerostris extrusa]|uniref:Uncharacterized protein n=1 Tax=Caerostris extrusa TaxID=172846 RepID=A0AAV4WQD5_CAEEX|nr:hypothetical protein CEXT_294881 [Caerostris extrusa]